METIKEIRNRIGLTQEEAAKATMLSLRSFADYERDESKINTPKYRYIVMELTKQYPFDESHGLLTIEDIREKAYKVLKNYNVVFCILFGSYARGNAKETSDVDLLIKADNNENDYGDITEKLRQTLKKKVDLISIESLRDNLALTEEVLKDGVRIYE